MNRRLLEVLGNWRFIRKYVYLALMTFILVSMYRNSLSEPRQTKEADESSTPTSQMIQPITSTQPNPTRIQSKYKSIEATNKTDKMSTSTKSQATKDVDRSIQYCECIEGWTPLNEQVFFKNSSAFYLIDKRIFKTFFVASSNRLTLDLVLILYVNILNPDNMSPTGRVIKFNVTDVEISLSSSANEYFLFSLEAQFDLAEQLRKENISVLKTFYSINMLIMDKTTGSLTQSPIKINTKYLDSPQYTKKSAAMCVTSYKDIQATNIDFWLLVNKKIGYEKITICDLVPAKSYQYRDLEIVHTYFKCLPNFYESSNTTAKLRYLSLPGELKTNGTELVYELLSYFAVNECYLENVDEFRLVTVTSIDELIIPRRHEYGTLEETRDFIARLPETEIYDSIINEKCEYEREKTSNQTELEVYLSELLFQNGVREPTSLYFRRGFYLKQDTVNELLNKFKAYLCSPDFIENVELNKDHIIQMTENNQLNGKLVYARNFTFIMRNNREDFAYIRSLININDLVIRRFFAALQDPDISTYLNGYNRLFMVSASANDFSSGRTIHNAKTTFEVTLAQSYRSLWQTDRSMPSSYASVPYNLGHLTQFSDMLQLDENVTIPVNQLHLDLNYLNCYFRPMIDQLSLRYKRSAAVGSRLADLPLQMQVLRETHGKTTLNYLHKMHDDYCKGLGEWEQLNERVYFKRSFAFYFIDKCIYRTFFVAAKNGYRLKLALLLEIEILDNDQKNITQVIKNNVTNVMMNSPWFVEDHGSVNIDAWFNLTQILQAKNYSIATTNFRVNLFYHDLYTNQTTKKPIEVNVKRYDVPETSKKQSMLCTKCLYLNDGEFKNMHWWFELNKKLGYDKVVICNNSIIINRFDELVKQYEGFVEVIQLKCLPNVVPTPSGHHREFLEFYSEVRHNGIYHKQMWDVFNSLAINECLLNYTDQYNYITIVDHDETILPQSYKTRKLSDVKRQIAGLTREDLESTRLKAIFINDQCVFENATNNNKTEMEYFLKDLVREHNQTQPTSFFFGQGYHINYRIIANIFSQLSEYLNSTVFEKNKQLGKDHLVTVVDYDSALENYRWPFNYTFLINNTADDINYIKNLIQIHRRVIRPFLKEKKNLTEDHCDRYDRLYIISGSVNDFSFGKTIHNTKTTYEVTLHHSYRSLGKGNRPIPASYATVPYDSGHLAHFRDTVRLPPKAIIPISQLHLDLNYLNCYFRPVIEQISREI